MNMAPVFNLSFICSKETFKLASEQVFKYITVITYKSPVYIGGENCLFKTFVYNRQLLINQNLPSVLYNLHGQRVSYEIFNI